MFETGVRQFRMVIGMVWGRKLDPDNIARLVQDALDTIAEFGEPGADARELTDGPLADPETRVDFVNRGLRRTARGLLTQSPFYARRFASAGIDLTKLDVDAMSAVPVTTKIELAEHQAEFQCRDVAPQLSTRTTGTTGRPLEIWISRYELGVWSGLSALTAAPGRTVDLRDLGTAGHQRHRREGRPTCPGRLAGSAHGDHPEAGGRSGRISACRCCTWRFR